jgi:hypothetical protein
MHYHGTVLYIPIDYLAAAHAQYALFLPYHLSYFKPHAPEKTLSTLGNRIAGIL